MDNNSKLLKMEREHNYDDLRQLVISAVTMPPHRDGSIYSRSYVERFRIITNGKTYIVLTKDESVKSIAKTL